MNSVFTNLAVMDVTSDGLVVRRLAPGVTFEEVQGLTGVPLLESTPEVGR